MPLGLGPWELGIVLVIILVVFGAGKLPQIGGAVGKSIREFKTNIQDDKSTEAEPVDTQPVAKGSNTEKTA